MYVSLPVTTTICAEYIFKSFVISCRQLCKQPKQYLEINFKFLCILYLEILSLKMKCRLKCVKLQLYLKFSFTCALVFGPNKIKRTTWNTSDICALKFDYLTTVKVHCSSHCLKKSVFTLNHCLGLSHVI